MPILDSRGRPLKRAMGFLGGLTLERGQCRELPDAIASTEIEVEEEEETGKRRTDPE